MPAVFVHGNPENVAYARTKGEQIAVAAGDGHGTPWTVTFQREGARWRVTTAAPVIP